MAVRLGEKERRLNRRILLWSGGSQFNMVLGGGKSGPNSARAAGARANNGSWAIVEEKVPGSAKMASMSAALVTTHISRSGAGKTGPSARTAARVGYGSARYAGENGSKSRDIGQFAGTSTLIIDSSGSKDVAATVVTGSVPRG